MQIMTSKEKTFPIECEFCHQPLTWDSVDLICSNTSCPQKLVEDAKVWCENLCPIDGLKWKSIMSVLSKHYTMSETSISVIMNIAKHGNIRKDNNKSELSEQNLVHKMLTSMVADYIPVSNYLLALNIPGLGKVSAKNWEEDENGIELIAAIEHFDSVYSAKEQTEIKNHLFSIVGDSNLVEAILNAYRWKFENYNRYVKGRLISSMKHHESKGTVVITGTLSVKRSDFENRLKEKGWTLASSITKNTDYLITNTPDSNTSKNMKADELGIPKVTEEYFVNNIM